MRIKSMYFSHNFRFFKSGQSLMIPISGNFRNSSRDLPECMISIYHACRCVIRSSFPSIQSLKAISRNACRQKGWQIASPTIIVSMNQFCMNCYTEALILFSQRNTTNVLATDITVIRIPFRNAAVQTLPVFL